MAKPKGKYWVLKTIGVVVPAIIVIIGIVFGIYCFRNMNYWQADVKKTMKAGFVEKQVELPDGSIINYGEGPDNGKALLLIHGQTGNWESYAKVLPELSDNWHVFSVDVYGHGKSTHNESKYYLDENGDDLIWFVDNVIQEETLVSGHSNGGIIAAYIAAYGGRNIVSAVLEDPPVFSTEPDYFEKSWAYHDTYKVMHEYINSPQDECWEAYYLRHCLWGQLYMSSSMEGLAEYAQRYHEKNPDKPVQLFFMPPSINISFLTVNQYDYMYGEHFYDYSWHSGISHEKLLSDIKVPTVFIHALDDYTKDGILMAASSNSQAERAVDLISDCELVELKSSHNIHIDKPDVFIDAINRMK